MTAARVATIVALCAGLFACAQSAESPTRDANAGIDSLNARLVQAYRSRDPQAYAALYTDTAVFEWPAFNTVRGASGMADMVRGNWPSLNEMDLALAVSSRRLAGDHATEFGAFQQSWRDSSGTRMVEYGRYVTLLARQGDGSWLIDRFFGFADSTRPQPARP